MAGRGEEAFIGHTLDRLDASSTTPYVLVNGVGENGSHADQTAEVARSFGAEVLLFEEQGKLPALQEGFKHLGAQALGPVLLLDANSEPLFPRTWSKIMTNPLEVADGPAAVSGLTSWSGLPRAERVLRGARGYHRAVQARQAGSSSEVYGRNMAVKFENDDVLNAVLELPHVWPGEDRLLADITVEHGGTVTQLIDPRSLVRSSARYVAPLTGIGAKLLLRKDQPAPETSWMERYIDRAAPGVTHVYHHGRLETIEDVRAQYEKWVAETTVPRAA